jgi:hypothetical protein
MFGGRKDGAGAGRQGHGKEREVYPVVIHYASSRGVCYIHYDIPFD